MKKKHPRPKVNPVQFDNIPYELTNRPQWVCWRYEWRNGNWTKPPLKIDGQKAKSNDATTWTTFEEVRQAYLNGGFDGVGYVFSKDDPYIGIDLDDCHDPETGTIEEWAIPFVDALDTYGEVSPSRTGFKLFAIGKQPLWASNRKKIGSGEVEIYDCKRVFAITGEVMQAKPIGLNDCQYAVETICAKLWPRTEANGKNDSPPFAEASTKGKDPYRGFVLTATNHNNLDDDQLWQAMFRASNGADIEALYRGDVCGHGNDKSAADLALCNALAFWTGKDAARMDRMFRQSGLIRPKWDKQHYGDGRTYGQGTIGKAIDDCRETIGSRPSNNGNAEEKSAEELYPIFTYDELMAKELPPVQWVIPDLLPVGLGILAGKPKLGKSVWGWSLAMAVASGNKFMGNLDTIHGDCLYLALEDSENRLKGRSVLMEKGLHEQNRPAGRLHYATTFPRMDGGSLELMDRWIGRVERPRLIVVDVWAKMKKPSPANVGNVYEWDYQQSAMVKEFADRHGIAALLLHHCKKGSADDALDEVSGSTGLTGCADTIAILGRERTDLEATLLVTGRDISERRLSILFDKDSLTWIHQGDAKEIKEERRKEREGADLSEKKSQFLNILELADPERKGASQTKIATTWTARFGKHINAGTLKHLAACLILDDVIEEVATGQKGCYPSTVWRRKGGQK